MPSFDVTAPNGKVFRVDAPEGATQEQAVAYVATDVYPRYLEENKPKPERGIGELFTQGVRRGVAQTGVLLGDYLPAMVGRGVETLGERMEVPGLAERGKSFAESQLREAAASELDIAKRFPREYESYEQVTGPLSAARYAAEALGEGLPTIVPGLVTGGAGAIATRGLASAAARNLAIGATTAAGSAAQTVPEAYASLLRETGKEEIGTALVAGGINAALEAILPASVISKLSGPAKSALIGSIRRRLGLGFAEGAVLEGLTEGAQEAVNKAAVSFVDQNKEFFTSENWKQILDSSIRGAIVGGTVTGATNVVAGQRAPTSETPPPAETPTVSAPTDTPEQRAFREDNLTLLTNLGYQAQDIGSIPFEDLQNIVTNRVLADIYFASKQAQPRPVEEPPAPPTGETPTPPTEAPAPPTETPPTEAPPTEAPPVETPPVETPPVETPPVAAPPTEAPPVETPAGTPTEAPAPTGTTAVETPEGPGTATVTPVAPKQTPAVPLSTITEEGPSKETIFRISDRDRALFEREIPGLVDVVRTIHANLYPGSVLNLSVNNSMGPFGTYTPDFLGEKNRPLLPIAINISAIKMQIQKEPDQKRYLLKTLFHEMSHPLQYTWMNTVNQKTFDAIVRQYVAQRNVGATERQFLQDILARGVKQPDAVTRMKVRQGFGLETEEDFQKFLSSKYKYPSTTIPMYPPSGPEYITYLRSFNEWIAEQGAKWLTKELKGLVPQTTFEKFQKSVLDGLRRMYKSIAEALGVKFREGAFEKMLREVYGKKTTTPPARSYEEAGRSSKEYPNIITRRISGSTYASLPTPERVSSDLEAMGVARTPVDAAASEPSVPTGPQTQLTKSWKDYTDVIGKDDGSVTGMFGRFMRSLTGANPGESLGRAFVRNVVNSNVPFMERTELRNLGMMIEGLMNSTGRVMGVVTMGPLGYSRANKNFFFHNDPGTKGLLDIFREVGVQNMDQAQIVFLAQRELALRKSGYRNSKGKSVLPEKTSSLSEKDLQDIINSADPAILKASAEFQKLNDRMVEMAVNAGLIPRELGERFKTLMYTPMYRLQNEELGKNPNITLAGGIYNVLKDPQGIDTFNKKVGELGVGGPVHGNLYENILRNYNAIVSAAVRNVAYQETANVLTTLKDNGGDTTIAEVFDKPGEETIQYRVNGQDRYMKIHDPAMFQAIAALSPQEKNNFVRAASWFTDLLRKGVTSTPPFQLRNLIRGLVELKVKTGMPVFEILRGTLDGARQTWRRENAYRDLVGMTGFGGFGFGSGSKDQASYMTRVYKSRELSLADWQKYPNAFVRFFDQMESVGEVTEMAPRIAYYNYLRRQGMPDKDAAWEAINLVNYHRHGAGNGILGNVVSNLIPLTPFLTARIQGLYRLVETGTKGAPTSLIGNGFIGIPAAIVTRGLMVTAINAGLNMMYGDDDWYKKLSVKDRLSNMYVKVGDVVVVLPRAFEIGEVFGGLPTLMLDSIRKQNGNDIAMGVGEFMKKTFLLEPVPQVVKPLAELYSNKNFYTGLPIENLSDKRSPKEERYDEYTSSFSKMVGHLSKYVELSPKQIDTLIRGYLGTAATLFLGTVDSLIGTPGTKPQGVFGDPNSVTGVAANLSGVASILKSESQLNNKFVGDFYEIKQKVTEIVTSMNDAARRGDVATVKSRIEQMPQARGLYTAFNSASTRLSEINRQMDIIRGRADIPVDRKTALLEKLREQKGQLAQQMVAAAERVGVTR